MVPNRYPRRIAGSSYHRRRDIYNQTGRLQWPQVPTILKGGRPKAGTIGIKDSPALSAVALPFTHDEHRQGFLVEFRTTICTSQITDQ